MSGFCFARDVSVRLRVSRTSNEAHRRFILLRGKSLILGKSLNSIDKDEVATVEDDRDWLIPFGRWPGASARVR